MESAAILFSTIKLVLVSSMSVMFGWQPMPDGSPRLEYLVQIEPELAATLKEGQSIPIVSDIPDGIGPIGRVRIVVGSDDLPRQKLVTNFKPWPKTLSRDGLIETQHRVPPVQPSGSRYGDAAKSAILTPEDQGAAAANPFGRALQQGAAEARNLAAGVKDQILPPTGSQLFGDGSVAGQAVRNALDDSANRLQRGFQQGVRQGVERVEQVADLQGQKLREAAESVGQRTREAADKFGRSLLPEQSVLNREGKSAATILPPDVQANSRQRIDQPIQPPLDQHRQREPQQRTPQTLAPPPNYAETSGANRNQAGSADANRRTRREAATSTTRTNNASREGYGNNFSRGNGGQANQPPATNLSWPNQQGYARDDYPREGQTREGYSSAGGDAFDVANRRNENPSPRYSNNEEPRLISPNRELESSARQSGDPGWPSNARTPAITRDMLKQSVDQPVDGGMATNGNARGYREQTSARPPFNTQPVGTQPTTTQNLNAQNLNTQPRDFGWGNGSYTGNDPNSTGGKTLFPLLLSWVLLSGSGAGNLYLFWSYLDVRHKYHGMVHGAPSRRDRYDD